MVQEAALTKENKRWRKGIQLQHRNCAIQGRSCKEPEPRERHRAGAALVWNNRETEMGDLGEIEALFFALISGSPGAEVVFLNQNLAVRLAAVL